MYKIILIFLIILFSFTIKTIKAEESLLTIKQQLDRLQREVSDLSKLVYNESESKINIGEKETLNLTAFDLRIYDIEQDIKKLNENFEELIFQIDDIKRINKELNNYFQDELLIVKNNIQNLVVKKNNNPEVIYENNENNEDNTLGEIIINSEDLSENLSNDKKENILVQSVNNDKIELTPEESFQNALTLLRDQKFIDSRDSLIDFIEKYPENSLTSSAHYWLGEIYILKKEYREAALVFAEGYQKFPKSNKAPDMLYKLSYSLENINKINDSCGTLKKLSEEFPEHKLISKVKIKFSELECESKIE